MVFGYIYSVEDEEYCEELLGTIEWLSVERERVPAEKKTRSRWSTFVQLSSFISFA